MLNKHCPRCAIAAFLLAVGCLSLPADEQTTVVKMADLPPAVKAAIHAQVGRGRLGEIDMSTEKGETSYDVEMRKGGRARSFTVDENGALLEKEVFLGETPAPVQAAIRKGAGASTIEEIDKQFEDGEVSYQVDLTNNNHERTFTVDQSGKLVELQVFLAETPGPVQRAVQKALGGGALGDITEEFEDGEITYEVEINPNGKSRAITFDPEGNVVSIEIDKGLAETPEAVQKAIHEMAQGGKLGAITQTTEDGSMTFDVDINRAGKWETVSIGTDGKVVP